MTTIAKPPSELFKRTAWDGRKMLAARLRASNTYIAHVHSFIRASIAPCVKSNCSGVTVI